MDIRCEYISGSDAKGCKVMLVGEADNVTVILNRDDQCTIKNIQLSSKLLYVLGYDIESDGSIGTLPVIGRIDDAKNSRHKISACTPTKDPRVDSGSGKLMLSRLMLTFTLILSKLL